MRYMTLLFMLACFALPVQARSIDGVDIPEQVQARADNSTLKLNGAGMRRKFFLDVYIGALYLPKPAGTPAEAIDQIGPKRMSMVFRRDVDNEKLVDAWNEGFANNLSSEEFRAQRARIANFNGLFTDVKKGDKVDLAAEPGVGTQVWINDQLRGKVSGDDFYSVLLRIWLGDHPADANLKKALLGDN